MKKPRYTSPARLDIIEAAAFYDDRSRNLGADFMAAVERAGWLLFENPVLGEQYSAEYRAFPLDDFPYSLYYELIDGGGIRVVAVLHHSRGTRFIRSRVRGARE